MTRRRLSRRHVQRIGAPVLAGIGLVALATVVVGVAVEPQTGTCNRNTAQSASVAFSVAAVEDLRQVVPGFLDAPELDGIKGLEVVIFEGPRNSVPIYLGLRADGARPPSFDRVVCVVTPVGEEHYYYDVDLSTANLDGLEVVRRDP